MKHTVLFGDGLPVMEVVEALHNSYQINSQIYKKKENK